tara:strand:- start:12159 stop:13100 length:942 start_codon:yes stop_codon:yes gene_type:complete
MKNVILLGYKGLGANLLHLSYCHQISDKYGPITIITLCKNLKEVLYNDPKIADVIFLDKYYKKFSDIINLSKFLSSLKIDNIFIFYPSIRFFLASKLSKIKNIYFYPLFSKKKLHLVKAAKKFTEEILNIDNCPTETKIFIDKNILDREKIHVRKNKINVTLGVGSSGPTTRWGSKNYIELINQLNKENNFFFFLLCGPNEKNIADEILEKIDTDCCLSLHSKKISEITPLISLSDIYVGNDSFGHHIASQCNIPSIIIMLDTPRAYTDYSKKQFRVLPEGIKDDDITHDSNFSPDSISVKKVLEKVNSILNL